MSILYYLGLVQWVIQKVSPRKDLQLGPVRGMDDADTFSGENDSTWDMESEWMWESTHPFKHPDTLR